MATHARQQYFADEVSLQKDSREFSIADEVQQKIDGIEEGAQVNVIETVKVNGEPLTPDEDKAVDITVPGVIDNLYSTSVSDALSARQGKVLYDYLQNIASRGRYLSNWNCATGLAMTNPEESPYEYKAGDYYTVSDVAALGGTNYRPDGSEYIIGQASTVVETEDVSVSDLYLYDGTNWLLLSNSGRAIAIDSSLSTTSTNPVENRVITNALNGKADATDINTKTFYLGGLTVAQEAYEWYLAGKNPILVKDNKVYVYAGGTSSEVRFTNDIFYQGQYSQWTSIGTTLLKLKITNGNVTSIEGGAINEIGVLRTGINYSTPYIPTYDGSPATKKYVDDSISAITIPTYTAGTGIDISNSNVISADTTVLATKAELDEKQDELTAGDNITIENVCVDISDMQGPAPDGFHIPLQSEWAAVKNIWTALGGSSSDGEVFGVTLKMLLLGQRNYSDGSIYLPGNGSYWSSSYYGATNEYASKIYFNRFQILPYADDRRAYGQPIRAFKNTPVTPDSSWTMLYGTSIAAGGIFRSATEGLISLSSDGQTWVTMADKNLGATIVWNDGDTLSQNNSGNFYQWGNNYGFPYSGSITTSSTQVDATGYGPGNYYESDTFIIGSEDWSSVQNNNLWGGVSQGSTQECNLTISAQVPEIEVDDEISSISENPVQNKVIKEALDEKVNLGLNKVFDSTTVEIGKWVDEGGMQGSGHHVTIDPNGEVSAYNVTSGGYNEAKLGTDGLTLLENSALGGDETTVISQDGITITEGQTTKTYNFLGNDRIATLSDVSGGTTQWGNIVGTLSNQTDLQNTLNTKADKEDVNVKVFHIASTNDLTNAQAAIDWWEQGRLTGAYTSLIEFGGGKELYGLLSVLDNFQAIFTALAPETIQGTSKTTTSIKQVIFSLTGTPGQPQTVTAISTSNYLDINYLDTDTSYSSSYTPQYDGSPATKKYVDDSVNLKSFGAFPGSGLSDLQDLYDWLAAGNYAQVTYQNQVYIFGPTNVTTGNVESYVMRETNISSNESGVLDMKDTMLTFAVSNGTVTGNYGADSTTTGQGRIIYVNSAAGQPSNPQASSFWYDTTNNKLKVYDGSNWNEVGAGDMNYADFNWQAKTGATITLDLASTITPTANFTVNAPSTIRDGQTYILRVNNGATAYTMTLGTNVTNPYQESLALTADGIDQFVFLAIGGNLELQPAAGSPIEEYVESVNGTSGPVTLKTINSTSIVGSGNIAVQATLSNITAAQIKTGTATTQRTVTAAALAGGLIRISDDANNILASGGKLRAGTQENYEALGTYDDTTVYLTV